MYFTRRDMEQQLQSFSNEMNASTDKCNYSLLQYFFTPRSKLLFKHSTSILTTLYIKILYTVGQNF